MLVKLIVYIALILLFVIWVFLFPIVSYLRFKGVKNSVFIRFYNHISAIGGFLVRLKLLSAILYFMPHSKRLASFRNFQYYNSNSFILISIFFIASVYFSISFVKLDQEYMIIGHLVLITYLMLFLGIHLEIEKKKILIATKKGILDTVINKNENKINILIPLVELDHTSISRDMINLNKSVFREIRNYIPCEETYKLDNIEEFYDLIIKDYFFLGDISFWLDPKVILLSGPYARNVNESFFEQINSLARYGK